MFATNSLHTKLKLLKPVDAKDVKEDAVLVVLLVDLVVILLVPLLVPLLVAEDSIVLLKVPLDVL